MKHIIARHPLNVAFCLLLGIAFGVIAPGFLPGAYNRIEAFLYPVAAMEGKVVELGENHVLVHIAGEKREPCDYAGISAYVYMQGDDHGRDAPLTRADGIRSDGHTKPVGSFDIGVWRIDRIGAAVRAEVWVTHFCQGKRRVTKIADVSLDKEQK